MSKATGLAKINRRAPALKAMGGTIAIKAGTAFAGVRFKADTLVPAPRGGFVAGCDYGVIITAKGPSLLKLTAKDIGRRNLLGGFHVAPGGNGRDGKGGDTTPAINPHSIWDRNFRPGCPDPRGMTLVVLPGGRKFWCDIYLLGRDHLKNGTSAFGVEIADGASPPQNPKGGAYSKLDYETAMAVMKHHGKGLLNAEESFAAYIGGVEQTALGHDPKITGLDAPRTSQWGVMQPFGSMWQWGHCGHPTRPRASVFGGSWFVDDTAGSRRAYVAYDWPGNSNDSIGARGRGDHMELV